MQIGNEQKEVRVTTSSTHGTTLEVEPDDSALATAHDVQPPVETEPRRGSGMLRLTTYLVLPGRVLFALIFVIASWGHFSRAEAAYAASQGVPLATLLVPLSGFLTLGGGLSVALGYRARLGAAVLVVFLVPVTWMMHPFWNVSDPDLMQTQQVMFLKNVSMLGAALLLVHFGSGPGSLDGRRARGR